MGTSSRSAWEAASQATVIMDEGGLAEERTKFRRNRQERKVQGGQENLKNLFKTHGNVRVG